MSAGPLLPYSAQFSSVANVTFPDVYQRFLDRVDALNFDFSWMFSSGCIFDVGFHDRLLLSTIVPLGVMFLMGITYSVALRRHSQSEDALQVVWQKHVSMALLVTFLVYTSVSSVVFQTFGCDPLDDGCNYLRADYRIRCDSPKHQAFRVYAAVMVVVYPVGIPALYAFLLFTNRTVLQDARKRDREINAKSTADLWKPYKPSQFHYEVIECGRRILLTGVVVFIYPNTSAQVAVTLAMAFAFSIISESLAPYLSPWDKWLSRTGHVIVFLSMYLALLLKVDVSKERNRSQRVFEVVLVAAHVSMVLAVVVETLMVVYSVRSQPKEDNIPRAGVHSATILEGNGVLGFDEPEEA